MDYSNIIVETSDYVTTITLNRPPTNAVNMAMRQELDLAITELAESKATRSVIITGAGKKGFSAGMDVADIDNLDNGPNGNDVFNRIARMPKPVIAALNGYALGGGCELALACHFRLIADTPRCIMGLPEVSLGIIPGWGGIQRLPRVVGKSRALEMILFSQRLKPQEALAAGLVDKVLPAADLLTEALAFAAALAKRPPLAVRAVLEGMAAGLEKGIEAGLDVDRMWAGRLTSSHDAKEGTTALLERREPVFRGE